MKARILPNTIFAAVAASSTFAVLTLPIQLTNIAQEPSAKPTAEIQECGDQSATSPENSAGEQQLSAQSTNVGPYATAAQIDKFRNGLTGTKLVGKFTITGAENDPPRSEEYTITTVKKLPTGDWWEITSRIKYGDHDLTVPMRMEVKWAANTPVITVDKLFIPGLGTFDARVLLRKDKYAGTWAHDDVGGHLFGTIEKLAPQTERNDQ